MWHLFLYTMWDRSVNMFSSRWIVSSASIIYEVIYLSPLNGMLFLFLLGPHLNLLLDSLLNSFYITVSHYLTASILCSYVSNVIECTYTDRDGMAHYTRRLYGIACHS